MHAHPLSSRAVGFCMERGIHGQSVASRLVQLFPFPHHCQVVNIPNSMTVLTDLLPVSLIMAERKLQVSGSLFDNLFLNQCSFGLNPSIVAVGSPSCWPHVTERTNLSVVDLQCMLLAGGLQLLQPRSDQPQRNTGPIQGIHRPNIHIHQLHGRGARQDPGG